MTTHGNAGPCSDERKTPKKPAPSSASLQQLVDHYNASVEAYNAALVLHLQTLTQSAIQSNNAKLQPLVPLIAEETTRDVVVELIQRQNHRLNRHIRPRAIEMLMEKVTNEDGTVYKNADGRTVGHTYVDILARLAAEFPEGSTSAACLRWYVVHLRDDAVAEGKPWPDLPQVRPRSPAKKKAA